jgi:hypothetical protein
MGRNEVTADAASNAHHCSLRLIPFITCITAFICFAQWNDVSLVARESVNIHRRYLRSSQTSAAALHGDHQQPRVRVLQERGCKWVAWKRRMVCDDEIVPRVGGNQGSILMSSLINDTTEEGSAAVLNVNHNDFSPFSVEEATTQQLPPPAPPLDVAPMQPLVVSKVTLPSAPPPQRASGGALSSNVLAEKEMTIAALRAALAVLTGSSSSTTNNAEERDTTLNSSSNDSVKASTGMSELLKPMVATLSQQQQPSSEEEEEVSSSVSSPSNQQGILSAATTTAVLTEAKGEEEQGRSEEATQLDVWSPGELAPTTPLTSSKPADSNGSTTAAAMKKKYSNGNVGGEGDDDGYYTKQSLVEEILRSQKPVMTSSSSSSSSFHSGGDNRDTNLFYDEWTSPAELENRMEEEQELAMFDLLQKAAKRLQLYPSFDLASSSEAKIASTKSGSGILLSLISPTTTPASSTGTSLS